MVVTSARQRRVTVSTSGVEYRLELDRRAADDLEHVAGCGELVDRAGEFGGALAQLAQEARVLNRDDGLVGKGFQDLDVIELNRCAVVPVASSGNPRGK